MITKLTNSVLTFFGVSSANNRPNNSRSRKRSLDVVPIRSPPVKRQKMNINSYKARSRERSLLALKPSTSANVYNQKSSRRPTLDDFNCSHSHKTDYGPTSTKRYSAVHTPVSDYTMNGHSRLNQRHSMGHNFNDLSMNYAHGYGNAMVNSTRISGGYAPVASISPIGDSRQNDLSAKLHIYSTKLPSPKSQIPSFKPKKIDYELKNLSPYPILIINHRKTPAAQPRSLTADVNVRNILAEPKVLYNSVCVNQKQPSNSTHFYESDTEVLCLEQEENSSVVSMTRQPAGSFLSKDIQGKFMDPNFLKDARAVNEYKSIIETHRLKQPVLREFTAQFRKTQFYNIGSQLDVFNREPPIVKIQIPEKEVKVFPDLTSEQEEEIDRILGPGPDGEVLVKEFMISITRKDIRTLKGLTWLNDEIINYYLNLIVDRGNKSENFASCHTMNTFFYPRLLEGGYSKVQRWTKRVDIFSKDFLLVPIHLQVHWCMAVVSFKNKTILYYDSMGHPNNTCLGTLEQYVKDEYKNKKNPDGKLPQFSTDDWTVSNATGIPQQGNASDCGMFSLTFAEHVAAEREFNFTQKDMPYLRRKMAYEIVHRTILTC